MIIWLVVSSTEEPVNDDNIRRRVSFVLLRSDIIVRLNSPIRRLDVYSSVPPLRSLLIAHARHITMGVGIEEICMYLALTTRRAQVENCSIFFPASCASK